MAGTNDLGILFAVCDGDKRHFDRFIAELTRLGYRFAVHFDHCSQETKDLFKSHPLFIDGYEDDNPKSFFGEDSRQSALDILLREKFEWGLSLDVDETLENNAPKKIREILSLNADLVDCPLLDLWIDNKHYRVDGPFRYSHREKFFHLTNGKWKYTHATIHAPKITFNHPEQEAIIVKFPLYLIHWGIMNMNDVRFHTERWNGVYTRRVDNNPYGFYPYLNDPETFADIREVDLDKIGPNFVRL